MSDETMTTLSVEEVLSKVESGELDPKIALQQETEGKQRKSLIAQLERIIATSEESHVNVMFLKNVKHNTTLYTAGQIVSVPAKDQEELLAAKVVKIYD